MLVKYCIKYMKQGKRRHLKFNFSVVSYPLCQSYHLQSTENFYLKMGKSLNFIIFRTFPRQREAFHEIIFLSNNPQPSPHYKLERSIYSTARTIRIKIRRLINGTVVTRLIKRNKSSEEMQTFVDSSLCAI